MARRVGYCFALAGLLLGLVGCTGFWNTSVQLPKLFVGPVMRTGTEGYVLISATDMPDGGLASIQFGAVGGEAVSFSDIDPGSVDILGESGFIVLAEDFTSSAGKGTLVAANAAAGVIDGGILRITFTITGANPTFTVDKTKVTLGSGLNTLIGTWTMGTRGYYTH